MGKEVSVRTNVCGLDHADIISSIAYAAHSFLGVMSDEASDIGLLCRRASACNYCRKLCRNLNELVLKEIETQLHVHFSQRNNHRGNQLFYLPEVIRRQ